MRIILSIVAILSMIVSTAFAEPVKPLGPLYGSTGTVFKPGQFATIFKYESFEQENYYDDNDKKDYDSSEINGATKKQVTKYKTTFRYGVMPRFDIRFVANIVEKELDRHSAKKTPAGVKHIYLSDDNSGFADSLIMGRYQLMSQKAGAPFFLAFGAGVKIPTGSTNAKDSNDKLAPVFLQNGTGSWDPKLELGLSKVMNRFRLDNHVMYTFNREGKQDTKKGNCFRYNVSGSYAVSRIIDLQLELFGKFQEKTEIDGAEVDNTGFQKHYIIPGIKFKFGNKAHFGVSVPYVYHRKTNGEQLMEEKIIAAKLALFF